MHSISGQSAHAPMLPSASLVTSPSSKKTRETVAQVPARQESAFNLCDEQINQLVNCLLLHQYLSDELQIQFEELKRRANLSNYWPDQVAYVDVVDQVFKKCISFSEDATADSQQRFNVQEQGLQFYIHEYKEAKLASCKNSLFANLKGLLEKHTFLFYTTLKKEAELDESLKKIKNQAEFLQKPKFFSSYKNGFLGNTRFSHLLGNSLGKMGSSSGSLTAVLAGYGSIQVGVYYYYNEYTAPAVINFICGSVIVSSQLTRAAVAAYQGNHETSMLEALRDYFFPSPEIQEERWFKSIAKYKESCRDAITASDSTIQSIASKVIFPLKGFYPGSARKEEIMKELVILASKNYSEFPLRMQRCIGRIVESNNGDWGPYSELCDRLSPSAVERWLHDSLVLHIKKQK